jgi:hypothetical protein
MPVPSQGHITVFTVFRLLTDFVCLYTYEFWLSLCKIARSSVILLLPLFISRKVFLCEIYNDYSFSYVSSHNLIKISFLLYFSSLCFIHDTPYVSTNTRYTVRIDKYMIHRTYRQKHDIPYVSTNTRYTVHIDKYTIHRTYRQIHDTPYVSTMTNKEE